MDNLNIRNEDVFSTRQGSTSRRPAARKQGRPSIGPGDLTPPSSGSQHEQEPPRMLMSPPPEEMLRTTRARSNESRLSSSPSKPRTPGRTPRQQSSQASKRKRVLSRAQGTSTNLTDIAERVPVASTSQVTIEATPNPRVRKQAKHELHYTDGPATPTKSSSTRESASPTKRALLQSPHSKNPNADYLPALQEFSRDTISKYRIHTPVRPYEPPRDRFTPPREVVYTPMPSVSKSSKRKSLPGSRTKGKERRLTIQIKKEPPEIDLSAPLPPGSPTDDPLLLRGPPPSTAKRTRPPRASLIPTHARDTPPISSSSPIRAPMGDTTQLMDMTMGGVLGDSDADLYDEDAPLPPVFDFQDELDDPTAEAEREQTPTVAGLNEEYQTLSVPTKADPPSSSTKERMDRWGRPVSPFPYQTSHSPTPVSPAGKPSGMSDTVGEEASPAHLHPTILAAADRAQTALQPSTLSYDMDESEPPLSTSPSLSSTPSPSKAVPHTLIVDAHDNEELPPSDPPSPLSPQAQLDVSSSDDYYLGHDTIAEYEIPLAGDDSSSEPGDFHTDNILGPLEEQPSYTPNNEPTESIATKDHSTKATVAPVAYQRPPPLTKSTQNETTYPTTSKHSAAAPNATFKGTTSVNAQADWSIAVDDEAEIEDAESVVRELSHEPDFRDDDAFRRFLPATPQSSKLQVASSPDNPFDSQPSAFAAAPKPSQAHEETHISSRLPRRPEHVMEPDVTELEMDDGAGLEDFDQGVIKITSEDPMAAARAAAILRLHRYDCLDKPSASKRTPSVLETVLRNSRRKSVRESGINKSMLSSAHRRRSLGGMIGDKVVRPGTPAVTLPDLLREAEESLIMDDEGPSIILPPAPDPPPGYLDAILNTPKPAVPVTATNSALPFGLNTSGPRDWTKMDWKVLDGCYTDERLSIGEKMGLAVGSLAPADQVDPESVADRFVELIGGEKVISGLGTAFTRANLLKRVRALKRKQSSGDAAPPCNSPSSKSSAQYADATQNFSMLMSPSFSFFGDFLPISKLTPRHALLPSIPTTKQPTKHSELQRDIIPPPVDSSSTAPSSLDNILPPDAVPPTPSSLAGKVKGLLYSYLPKTNKVSTASQPPQPPKGPNLPPPPPELFRKPRAAITTPLPKPISKPPNPRELVQLNPVGRVSAIKQPGVARMAQASSRSTESSTAKPVPSRERRGSNVSVKDLVKTFESLEKQHAAERNASQVVEVKQKQSIHDLKAKPVWRS